eukprot:m51a1_g11826 putative nadp-dependent malate dehydrogenase (544) ;mRNA; r:423465-425453
MSSPSFTPAPQHILADPVYNKGTAFTTEERKALRIRGLLPHAVETIEAQAARAYAQLTSQPTPLLKYLYLSQLSQRNQTLFFYLVQHHVEECVPLVYTPTVGEGCTKFSAEFRNPTGLYITPEDKGHVAEILENWPHEVEIIVVTDGGRILGLGDLGSNGMGIPIGKLHLYIACAGFRPDRTLPVMIDVGTNRQELLDDPMYLGVRKARLGDAEYFALLEEFMTAVRAKWPRCLVQFEDFPNPRCFQLLDTWFGRQFCFNDDIQGTGAVILAGVINAVRATGVPVADHRFMFLGAGSAATGVAGMIAKWIATETHVAIEQARRAITMFDVEGFVVKSRVAKLPAHLVPYAADAPECPTFLDAIRHVKPTAIIGLSGAGRLFTKPVVEEVAALNKRPIVFALSNPTSKAECVAEDAYTWSDGRAIFASGSPFPNVEYKGRTYTPGQGNNMFIFPGLGFGAVAAQAKLVTDQMIMRSALELANTVSQADIDAGLIFPAIARIHEITQRVSAAVMEQAFEDGVAQLHPRPASCLEYVKAHQWHPAY